MKIFTIFLYLAISIYSQDKTFIREYSYNASDDDSKNTARTKAIEQVKFLLLEELGTYVESYVELQKVQKDNELEKFIKTEINRITAGITLVKILLESWNGEKYWVKAEVRVNPESVLKKLNDAIENRSSGKELKRLNKILAAKEIDLLKQNSEVQKLVFANTEKQKKIELLRKRLKELSSIKKKYESKIIEDQKKISKAERIIAKAKKRISKQGFSVKNIVRGMTKDEVIDAVGKPVSDNWAINGGNFYLSEKNSTTWYYGNRKIFFRDNLVSLVN